MSLTCPLCKTVVSTRDGHNYNTHFATVTAQRPCKMSGKGIKKEESKVEAVQHTDLHHSQGVRVPEALAAADEDAKKEQEKKL